MRAELTKISTGLRNYFGIPYFAIIMKMRLLLTTLFLLIVVCLAAQCPMCKIAAQSNLENGGTAGTGLNTGILYILLIPYFVVGTIGIVWYRNRKKFGTEDSIDIDAQLQQEISTII